MFRNGTQRRGEKVAKDNNHRVMISIDKDLLDSIDKRCEELGMSRTAYITAILREHDLSIVKKQK